MLAHTGRGPPADDDDETVSAFVRTNSGLSAKGDPDMWPAGASAASTAAAASSHLCSGPEFHQRMAHMSACHPLFHFIFDRSGALLAANHAAMASLRDRLGERPSYNLEQYLSLGECTDEASSSQVRARAEASLLSRPVQFWEGVARPTCQLVRSVVTCGLALGGDLPPPWQRHLPRWLTLHLANARSIPLARRARHTKKQCTQSLSAKRRCTASARSGGAGGTPASAAGCCTRCGPSRTPSRGTQPSC